MDCIEKFANPVYSISVAILLRLKEFPKFGRSNPFFGTMYLLSSLRDTIFNVLTQSLVEEIFSREQRNCCDGLLCD
jgi:hypothetical protein